MIEISFPDGSVKKYESGISAYEIAAGISKSLVKKAIIAEFDGQLYDLKRKISKSGSLKIITNKEAEGVETIRHDAAHLLAQAVQELYDVQVTIGPAIEYGFYYDFAKDEPFLPEDLVKIEKRMRELADQAIPVEREEWDRDDAIEFFKKAGEAYKAEIISAIPQGETISLYRQGDFIDLCRGPHAPDTSYVKHFKLTKIAGAYWRGDSNNPMLQRIYGLAFASKEDLDNHLHLLAEAEKRDHRKLGKALELFHIQEEATGSVFWHENGAALYKIVEDFISKKLHEHDYVDVKTPLLIDRVLWEKSGHWDKFRENMFIAESEDRSLALKPMNCPGHVQIFNQKIRSYRDLPFRMSEFGCCHRNEPSGSLHGLMRVRSFTQDDAHIFCMEEQIADETKKFSDLLLEVYKSFGFNEVSLKFSDRPETRAGSDEIWDKAESSLLKAIKETGLAYELNPGEGAFYGPKIEFVLKDAIGRQWQCGTLQVDFVLPERLDAKYTARDGSIKRPVMLHRAILGSFERFIGILIENYAGTFPYWLAPKQVAVLNVTNSVDAYAKEVFQFLKDKGVRAVIDISSDKIGYKIRNYVAKRIPYQLIIGNQEAENRSVNIRKLGTKEQVTCSLAELMDNLG